MVVGTAGSGASTDKLPHNHWEESFNSRTGKKDVAFDQRAEGGNHAGI